MVVSIDEVLEQTNQIISFERQVNESWLIELVGGNEVSVQDADGVEFCLKYLQAEMEIDFKDQYRLVSRELTLSSTRKNARLISNPITHNIMGWKVVDGIRVPVVSSEVKSNLTLPITELCHYLIENLESGEVFKLDGSESYSNLLAYGRALKKR